MRQALFCRGMFAAAGLALGATQAAAHGAVTMENDVCKMKVGQMFMHFTGYQPQSSRAEFCQDIPEVGRAIIVLDMVDSTLREMPTEFEIVKGAPAMKGPMGEPDPKDIVVRLPAKLYPNGSLKADMTFTEAGDYYGMVMVGAPNPTMAVFPFSVGRNTFWINMAIFLGVMIVAAGGVFWWVVKREQAGRPSPAAGGAF